MPVMNVKISIEHDSSQIPVVAKMVCHLFTMTQGDSVKNMELAVVELLTNIINHSDGAAQRGLINIRCRYTGDDFTVTISESGTALSAKVVRAYTDEIVSMPEVDVSNLDDILELPESGWGIQLIKSVCDEVSYNRVADKNVYKMTFDLSSTAV